MFSNPNVMTEVEVITADGTEFCDVKFLIVSGGGQSAFCGGGSGRIFYLESHLVSSHDVIQIVVGGERNESTLSIVGEISPGTKWIVPAGGSAYNEAGRCHGGDGYSGGAGYCYEAREECGEKFEGGSNGGPGHGSSSGKATNHGP